MNVYEVNTSGKTIGKKFDNDKVDTAYSSYTVLANTAEEAIDKTKKTFSDTENFEEFVNEVIFIAEIDIV